MADYDDWESYDIPEFDGYEEYSGMFFSRLSVPVRAADSWSFI